MAARQSRIVLAKGNLGVLLLQKNDSSSHLAVKVGGMVSSNTLNDNHSKVHSGLFLFPFHRPSQQFSQRHDTQLTSSSQFARIHILVRIHILAQILARLILVVKHRFLLVNFIYSFTK